MLRPTDINADQDMADGMMDVHLENLPAYFEGLVPFTRRLGRVEKQDFLRKMMKDWPPEGFIRVEKDENGIEVEVPGSLRISSPKVLALELSEGGRELLDELTEAFVPVLPSAQLPIPGRM